MVHSPPAYRALTDALAAAYDSDQMDEGRSQYL